MAVPTLTAEIDFQGNPTATYSDIQKTADDVQGFWRCNSSSTFLDERGLNNGTVSGSPSTTAGPYLYDSDLGLTFDGSNDYAYVPNSGTLSTKGAFTIMGWFKTASIPGSTIDLVTKRGAWTAQFNSSAKLVFTCRDDLSTATVTSNTVLATGTWYHLAFVYGDTYMAIYVNGVLDNTVAYSSGLGLEGQPIRFAHSEAQTAPAYQSNGTYHTGSGTTAVPGRPTSTADGDLLIAHLVMSTAGIASAPSGWQLIGIQGGPSLLRAFLYSKIAASEPTDWTWNLTGANRHVAVVSRFNGQHANWLAQGVRTASGTGSTLATGAHVTALHNSLLIACFAGYDSSGSGEASLRWDADSGTEYTDNLDLAAGVTVTVGSCFQTVATPSAVNITGTAPQSHEGNAVFWVEIAGTGQLEYPGSFKDWSYTSRALTAGDLASFYYSKDSGEGTYTSIKSNVRHFSTTGPKRQYELNRMEASNSDVLLRDFSHDFDPGDSTSIYSPNVIPVRRIRLKATWNSTTYPVLKEFIERWPPQGGEAVDYQEIAVTSVDGFDLMSQARVTGTLPVGYSGSQINALLNKAFWPVADRAIDTGQFVMAAVDLGTGTDALSMIQEIADSERGVFFVDSSGIATFHDAAHRGSQSRSTTSQATFADDVSGSAIIYQDLSPSADKDLIINDWTVSPDTSAFQSAPQRLTDWASVAKYGLRSQTRSTRLASNSAALEQAGNLLNETAGFAIRFDSMLVIPTTTAGYDKCLDLRIGDRVTVKRGTGAGWTGALIQKDCFVEGKAIEASPGNPWRFTFSLSPVSLGNYFATIVRDGPVSYWRMDTIT